MNIYDFKYRVKRDKSGNVLIKSFTANTKQDAIIMFKGVVDTSKYTIIAINKI